MELFLIESPASKSAIIKAGKDRLDSHWCGTRDWKLRAQKCVVSSNLTLSVGGAMARITKDRWTEALFFVEKYKSEGVEKIVQTIYDGFGELQDEEVIGEKVNILDLHRKVIVRLHKEGFLPELNTGGKKAEEWVEEFMAGPR